MIVLAVLGLAIGVVAPVVILRRLARDFERPGRFRLPGTEIAADARDALRRLWPIGLLVGFGLLCLGAAFDFTPPGLKTTFCVLLGLSGVLLIAYQVASRIAFNEALYEARCVNTTLRRPMASRKAAAGLWLATTMVAGVAIDLLYETATNDFRSRLRDIMQAGAASDPDGAQRLAGEVSIILDTPLLMLTAAILLSPLIGAIVQHVRIVRDEHRYYTEMQIASKRETYIVRHEAMKCAEREVDLW